MKNVEKEVIPNNDEVGSELRIRYRYTALRIKKQNFDD